MVDERLLERMQVVAIGCQPLDGDDLGVLVRDGQGRASSSVVRVSITSGCSAPFTRRVISRFIVYMSPLVVLVYSW